MGRFCRICFRIRPNEQFGGRGHRAIVCRKCRRTPRAVWKSQLLQQEISGFLDQSNISAKNIKRLTVLEASTLEGVAILASVVKRVAQAQPRRRNRWKLVRQQHAELFRSAINVGILSPEPPRSWSLSETDSEMEVYEEDDRFPYGDCFEIWIEPRHYEHEPSFNGIDWKSPFDDEVIDFDFHYDEGEHVLSTIGLSVEATIFNKAPTPFSGREVTE